MKGSLANRMLENRMFCKDIAVGTYFTEYHYTDRDAYMVTGIVDKKKPIIDAKKVIKKPDGTLETEEGGHVCRFARRCRKWWHAVEWTPEILASVPIRPPYASNLESAFEGGARKVVIYTPANLSFGVADPYRDPSF